MSKTIQQLSEQYAEKKVKESPNNEYKNYPFLRQKALTRFDGFDIEQAYEDGAEAIIEDIDRFIFENIQMKDLREPHLMLYVIRKKFKELKGE